jgi:hypothetical protein
MFVLAAVLLAPLCFFAFPQNAHAIASLSTSYAVNAPSSTMNGLAKQIRIDTATGKVYTLGTSAVTFLEFSVDGSSVSVISYNISPASFTTLDFVINSGQLFMNQSGGSSPQLARYDLSGSSANFAASSSLAAGTASIAFGPASSLYASKGTALVPYDYSLVKTGATTTLTSAPTRMSYSGAKVFYITSAGRIASNDLLGTDVTLATGLGANQKGILASSDATFLYHASTTAIRKISASTGAAKWSKTVSNLLAIDMNTTNGKIYTVDTGGVIQVYDPIYPVATFTATSSGSNVTLSIVSGAADTDFGGVMIRRSAVSFPTSSTDGTGVTSTVENSFVDSGLSDGTYYYTAFNTTADGYYSTGVTTSVSVDGTPPSAPVLSASRSGTSVSLSWTQPDTTASFMLRRSTLGAISSNSDGSTVSTTDVSITSYVDSGLSDGTYYYGIFAIDSNGNYSSAGTAPSVTIDTLAPSVPASFTATASGSSITLDWTNPNDADFSYVTIQFSTSSYPATPNDGTTVASTAATQYTLSNLSDATYYFSIFAYDYSGNYSNAVTSTARVNTVVPSPSPSPSPTPVSAPGLLLLGIALNTVPPQATNAGDASKAIVSNKTSAAAAAAPNLKRVLTSGSSGSDVKALQKFLNALGFTVAAKGAGSPGQETTFFGPATTRAIIKFQEAYADEILKPLGLKKGTGVLGAATMKKMQEMQ